MQSNVLCEWVVYSCQFPQFLHGVTVILIDPIRIDTTVQGAQYRGCGTHAKALGGEEGGDLSYEMGIRLKI